MMDHSAVRDDGVGQVGFPHMMQLKRCSENKPQTPPGFSPLSSAMKEAETAPAETEVAAPASQLCDEL